MILGLRLRLREGRRLTLGVAPLSRAVFGLLLGLSLYVLLFGVLFEGEATVFKPENAAAWLLVLATAAGLLYEERWTFDGERGSLEGRFGLLFLSRRRIVPIAELQEVRVERYRRGTGAAETADAARTRPWRAFARLTVVGKDGTVTVLDTSGGLGAGGLRRSAERIARYCGLPMKD